MCVVRLLFKILTVVAGVCILKKSYESKQRKKIAQYRNLHLCGISEHCYMYYTMYFPLGVCNIKFMQEKASIPFTDNDTIVGSV